MYRIIKWITISSNHRVFALGISTHGKITQQHLILWWQRSASHIFQWQTRWSLLALFQQSKTFKVQQFWNSWFIGLLLFDKINLKLLRIMVQNHLLSQCHKIGRWVYGCNNMSSATRYDKVFEVYVIYFGDDNKGYKITKYNRFIKDLSNWTVL